MEKRGDGIGPLTYENYSETRPNTKSKQENDDS